MMSEAGLDWLETPPPPPARPAEAHKGTFGTLTVVGGSATMIGAPAIAAGAALRSGVGLARIATWPAILPFCLTIEPGATGIALSDSVAEAFAALDEADPEHPSVLAIGPGLKRGGLASELVPRPLNEARPVVLDADGLNVLAERGSGRQNEPTLAVLTPHPGEFRRLATSAHIEADPTDPDDRPRGAGELARHYRAVVVLKGQHTIVTDGQRAYRNRTGNPALATAGTGDVLTGVIGSLIAQGMPGFEAAVLGVHLHGLAGDLWAKQVGPAGLTARELAARLPTARAQLEGPGEPG